MTDDVCVYSRGYYGNAASTRGQRRGWGRGGRGRGWTTRGGLGGGQQVVKAELDNELDQYMTSTE